MSVLRLAVRHLARNRGFTAAAAGTLALGIGFVTTLFSLLNAVAFSDLPFDRGRRVVAIDVGIDGTDDLARRQTSLEGLGVAGWAPRNVVAGEQRVVRSGAQISWNFAELLQAAPRLGRPFREEDARAGAAPVALISHALWVELFAASPEAIGADLAVDGVPAQIIGVMPQGFGFPRSEHVWTPVVADRPIVAEGRRAGTVVFGRLKEGVTAEQASTEFTALRQATLLPEDPEGRLPVEVTPYARRTVKGRVLSLLVALLSATGLVLVLACANVTTLLIGQASHRIRDLAVQASLGASHGRLIGQLLLESVLLAGLGTAAGVGVAVWAVDWIGGVIASESALTGGPPSWVTFEVDGRVLAFSVVAALIAAALAGVAPALQATRVNCAEALKGVVGGGPFQIGRLTRAVVQVQMAASVTLTVGAGLFLMVLSTLLEPSAPFDLSVLSARVTLSAQRYPDAASRSRYFAELLRRLDARPGIAAAALTSAEMFRPSQARVQGGGRPSAGALDWMTAGVEVLSPGFFATLGVRLVEGRDFSSSDLEGREPVVIVNRALAAQLWPDTSPLGRRLRLGEGGSWHTVIGLAPDLGTLRVGGTPRPPAAYVPLWQQPQVAMTLIIRGKGDGAAMSALVAREATALDATAVPGDLLSARQILEMERIGILLPGVLFIVCGAAALVLASVGVYGVVSFSVAQRTREIGIRIALGARRAVVVRMLVTRGLKNIAVGLGSGVALALGLSAALRSVMADVGATAYSPVVYGAVVTLLLCVGVVALLVPALRGSRLNPVEALRVD